MNDANHNNDQFEADNNDEPEDDNEEEGNEDEDDEGDDDDEEDFDRLDGDDENENQAQQQLAFDNICERISLNDPECTSFQKPWITLNDYKAMRLGIALVDNTHLKELTIFIPPIMTVVGANALRNGILASRVKVLQLNRGDELPFDMSRLYSQTMHQLESLNLVLPIDDENLAILGECLSGNKSLRYLFLHDIENMTPHGAQSLVNGLCKSQLKTLNLIGNADDDHPVHEITREAMKIVYLQGVLGCPTIQCLELYGITGNVHDLATALPKISELTISDIEEGLSLSDVQVLGDGLRQATHLKLLRLWTGNLEDKHLHVLSPILANHPSLEHFDVQANKIGDDAVAWFVKHWNRNSKIRQLDFTQNNIGSMGAQSLLRAAASHPLFWVLTLDKNKAIGYDGLHRIGQELMMPGLKLIDLGLYSVTTWVEYDDATCKEAVQQQAKRAQGCKSLLEGVWASASLQELSLDGNHLPLDVTDELDVVIQANQNGRIHLSQQDREPPAFWCHFLAQQSEENDLLLENCQPL